MSLTVREKDHWRERIARRIDHAIEEMQAKEDPGFDKRIREQAEQQGVDIPWSRRTARRKPANRAGIETALRTGVGDLVGNGIAGQRSTHQ